MQRREEKHVRLWDIFREFPDWCLCDTATHELCIVNKLKEHKAHNFRLFRVWCDNCIRCHVGRLAKRNILKKETFYHTTRKRIHNLACAQVCFKAIKNGCTDLASSKIYAHFFLDAKRRSFFLQFRQIHCTVRTKHPKIRSSQFMEKTRCEGTKKAGKKQQLTKPLETLQMDKLKIVRALLCVCVCFFLNSFFHRASMLFPIALFEWKRHSNVRSRKCKSSSLNDWVSECVYYFLELAFIFFFSTHFDRDRRKKHNNENKIVCMCV